MFAIVEKFDLKMKHEFQYVEKNGPSTRISPFKSAAYSMSCARVKNEERERMKSRIYTISSGFASIWSVCINKFCLWKPEMQTTYERHELRIMRVLADNQQTAVKQQRRNTFRIRRRIYVNIGSSSRRTRMITLQNSRCRETGDVDVQYPLNKRHQRMYSVGNSNHHLFLANFVCTCMK